MKIKYLSKSFYQYHEYCFAIACAELSPMPGRPNVFYFNRLYVPPKLRCKNVASNLLLRIKHWADEHNIIIILDINPYGDMNLYNLIKLYKQYDFISVSKKFKSKMIRIPNATHTRI